MTVWYRCIGVPHRFRGQGNRGEPLKTRTVRARLSGRFWGRRLKRITKLHFEYPLSVRAGINILRLCSLSVGVEPTLTPKFNFHGRLVPHHVGIITESEAKSMQSAGFCGWLFRPTVGRAEIIYETAGLDYAAPGLTKSSNSAMTSA